MDALNYFANRFNLDLNQKSPIEILEINRPIMAECLSDLEFNLGAEVGVAKGDHAKILCEANPNLHLYCIDAWEHYKHYEDYLTTRLNYFYDEAVKTLSNYDTEIIRKYSMDAVKDFKDESLDFVYIDGAHDFKNVAMDVTEWYYKVKPGGILYGHDFKRSKNPRLKQHVVDAIQAYTYAWGINPWFVLGTQGRNDGQFREGTREWMIIKS